MSLAGKTAAWVQQGIISADQQKHILDFERAHSNKTFWNTALIIAGILIGLGFCLLIAANWKVLPPAVKLVGDFALFGVLIYATHRSMQAQRKGLTELFAILSFLCITATIGLIGQVFQLSGGWHRFAMGWALLGIPFVLLSKSNFLNMGWLLLLGSAFNWQPFWDKIAPVFDNLFLMALAVTGIYLLHYIFLQCNQWTQHITVLPRAAAKWLLWLAYLLVYWVGIIKGLDKGQFMAYLFVFAFLAFRMYAAAKAQNIKPFKRNALLAEIYIFAIFASKLGSLWSAGFGFILGGILLLLLIWLLRKTTRYIKQMEVFK